MKLSFFVLAAALLVSPATQVAEAQRRDCGYNGCPRGDRYDDRRRDEWHRRQEWEREQRQRASREWRRQEDMRRGSYFDRRSNTRFVVIEEHHRYRLPPPRYGQHYYRDHRTGEIILVATATGLILWALTN